MSSRICEPVEAVQAESAELVAARAAVTVAEERRDTFASRVAISKDGIAAAKAHRDTLRQKAGLGEKVTPAAVGAADKAITDAVAHYELMLEAMPVAETEVNQARAAVKEVEQRERQAFVEELRQEKLRAEEEFLEAAKRRSRASARHTAAAGGWPIPA